MRLRHAILFSVALGLSGLLRAQYVESTQRLFQPGLTMIGLTGSQCVTQASLLYRNQWPGIPSTYLKYGLAVDGYSEKLQSGWGIGLFHDRSGSGFLQVSGLQATLAPRFKVGQGTIITGVSYSLEQHGVDWSQLVFGQPRPVMFPPFATGSIPEEGSSFGHQVKLAIGYAHGSWLFHVQSSYAMVPSFFKEQANGNIYDQEAYLAYLWRISDNIRLTPAFFFGHENWSAGETYNTSYTTIAPGLNANIHDLMLGARYEWGDRLTGQIGYEFAERVFLSYSFDLTVPSLGTQTLGAHEIGIRVTIDRSNAESALIRKLWVL